MSRTITEIYNTEDTVCEYQCVKYARTRVLLTFIFPYKDRIVDTGNYGSDTYFGILYAMYA